MINYNKFTFYLSYINIIYLLSTLQQLLISRTEHDNTDTCGRGALRVGGAYSVSPVNHSSYELVHEEESRQLSSAHLLLPCDMKRKLLLFFNSILYFLFALFIL